MYFCVIAGGGPQPPGQPQQGAYPGGYGGYPYGAQPGGGGPGDN